MKRIASVTSLGFLFPLLLLAADVIPDRIDYAKYRTAYEKQSEVSRKAREAATKARTLYETRKGERISLESSKTTEERSIESNRKSIQETEDEIKAAKARIDGWSTEITAHNTAISTLDTQLTRLGTELTQKKTDITNQEKTLADAKTASTNRGAETVAAKAAHDKSAAALAEAVEVLHGAAKDVNIVAGRLAALQEELKEVKESRNAAQEESRALTAKLKGFQDNLARLQADKTKSTGEQTAQLQKIADLNKEIADLQAKIATANKESKELEPKIEALRTEIAKTEKLAQSYAEAVQTQKDLIVSIGQQIVIKGAENTALQVQEKEKRREGFKLMESLKTDTTSKTDLETKKADLEKVVKDRIAEIQKLGMEADKTGDDLKSAQRDLDAASALVADYGKQAAVLLAEKTALETRKTNLAKEIETTEKNLKASLESLMTKEGARTESEMALTKQKLELTTLNDKTDELNKKISKLEEELKPEAEKLKAASAEVEKLEADKSTQTAEIKAQTKALAEATAAAATAKKALEEKQDLDTQVEQLGKAAETLAAESAKTEKDTELARAALKSALEKLDSKKAEIEAADKKVDAVESQLKEDVEALRKAKAAVAEAKEKSDKAADDYAQAKKVAEEAAAELKAAQDASAAEDVIAALKEKLTKAEETAAGLEKIATEEEKALDSAKSALTKSEEKVEATQTLAKAEAAAAEPLKTELATLKELQETAKEGLKTAEGAQTKAEALVMENATALKTAKAKLALVATAESDLTEAKAAGQKAETAKIDAETALAKTEGALPVALAKVKEIEKEAAEKQAELDALVKMRDQSVADAKAKAKELAMTEETIATLTGQILKLQGELKAQRETLAQLKAEEDGLPGKFEAVQKKIATVGDEEAKAKASVTTHTTTVSGLKDKARMQAEKKGTLEGMLKTDGDQVSSYETRIATLAGSIEKTEKQLAVVKGEAEKLKKSQDDNNAYILEAPKKIEAATAAQNKAETDKRDAEKLVVKLNADLNPQVARHTLLASNVAGWTKDAETRTKDLEKPTAELAKVKTALESLEKQIAAADETVKNAQARIAHLAKVDGILENQQKLLVREGIPSEERALALANESHLGAKRVVSARFATSDADEKAYDAALEAERLAKVTVENETAELARREKARDDVKTAIAETEATKKSHVDGNTALDGKIKTAQSEIKGAKSMIEVLNSAIVASQKHLEKLALDIPAATTVEGIEKANSENANKFAVNEERLTTEKQLAYEKVLKTYEDEMKAAKLAGARDGAAAGSRLGEELGGEAGGKKGDLDGGMNRDYDAAKKIGEARGREKGLAQGFKDGEAIGKEKGKAEGLPKGWAKAYDSGKTAGTEKGKTDGFNEANNDENREAGRLIGYEEGLKKAKTTARAEYQPARDAEEKAIRALPPAQTLESFDNNEEPAPPKPPQASLWNTFRHYAGQMGSWLIPLVYAGPTGGTILDKDVPLVTDKYKKYATVETPYDYEPFNEAYRASYDAAYASSYLAKYKDQHLSAYLAAYKEAYSVKTLPSYDAEKMRGDKDGYDFGYAAVYETEKERSRKIAHAEAAKFWESEGAKDKDKIKAGFEAGELAGKPVGLKAGKENATAEGKAKGLTSGYDDNIQNLIAKEKESGKTDAQAEYAANFKPEALEAKLVDGNADGRFERGEAFTLSVKVRNFGGRPVPKGLLTAEIDPAASQSLELPAITGKALRELPGNTLANYTKVLAGKVGTDENIVATVNVRLDGKVLKTFRVEAKAEGYVDVTITDEKSDVISEKKPLNVGNVGEWKQTYVWIKNISGKKDLNDLNLYVMPKDPNVTLSWDGHPNWLKVPPFRPDGWSNVTVWIKVNKAGVYSKNSLRMVVGTTKGTQEKKYLLDREVLAPLTHR